MDDFEKIATTESDVKQNKKIDLEKHKYCMFCGCTITRNIPGINSEVESVVELSQIQLNQTGQETQTNTVTNEVG